MPIKNTAVSHHTLRSLEVVHLDRSLFTIQARHQKPSADESSTAAAGCEHRAGNLRYAQEWCHIALDSEPYPGT